MIYSGCLSFFSIVQKGPAAKFFTERFWLLEIFVEIVFSLTKGIWRSTMILLKMYHLKQKNGVPNESRGSMVEI